MFYLRYLLLCLSHHTTQQFLGGSAKPCTCVKSILENTLLAHSTKEGRGREKREVTVPFLLNTICPKRKKKKSETGKRDVTTTIHLICRRISQFSQSLFLVYISF